MGRPRSGAYRLCGCGQPFVGQKHRQFPGSAEVLLQSQIAHNRCDWRRPMWVSQVPLGFWAPSGPVLPPPGHFHGAKLPRGRQEAGKRGVGSPAGTSSAVSAVKHDPAPQAAPRWQVRPPLGPASAPLALLQASGLLCHPSPLASFISPIPPEPPSQHTSWTRKAGGCHQPLSPVAPPKPDGAH